MSKGSFGFGLVLGALSGAAAAYLFAPQSGKELQTELEEKADNAKKKAVLALDEAVTEAEIWVDQKKIEKDLNNDPAIYEVSPETVTVPPEHTALDEQKDPIDPLA